MAVKVKQIGGIPVFLAELGEGCGMLRVSLVDSPAVEKNFDAFKKDAPAMYAVHDEEKRLVRGVVMRADYPIYRRDPEMGEYYVVFTAETIRQMAEKYICDGRCNDVNLQHVEGSDVEGVNMVQMFIKGGGVTVAGFDDVADGSLFAEYHVVNDDVWEQVKAGTFKGFSIEVIHELTPNDNAFSDALRAAFGTTNPTKNDMSKFDLFIAALGKALQSQFGTMTTDKGVIGWDGNEPVKVGDVIELIAEDGTRTPAADGDYIADGKVYSIAEGKLAAISDVQEAPQPEGNQNFGKVVTDKGELSWEGEEDLAAGREVFDAEGNPAADGEYVTEDGKVIVVVEGKVAEIRDNKAEVDSEQYEVSEDRIAKLEKMVLMLCDYLGILVIEEGAESAAPINEQLSAMRREIAALKASPAGVPAHEQFAPQTAPKPVTGNPKTENLMKILRAGR